MQQSYKLIFYMGDIFVKELYEKIIIPTLKEVENKLLKQFIPWEFSADEVIIKRYFTGFTKIEIKIENIFSFGWQHL